MNMDKEIMEFTAITYNNYVYHFSITPSGEISCSEFGITIPASIIEIKPNFVLRRADGSSIYSLDDHLRNRNLKKNNGESLIFKWNIPTTVLEYLSNNNKVMYSTETAFLCGFPIEKANDANYKAKEIRRYQNNPDKSEKCLRRLRRSFESGKFN